ncbi:DUF2976 domain-containing protein [Diaphorobacter sp. HDW4A]|uniref:DUF2976 domain-containing protein n=1 Tax=Diaphorobacter sp. HDW4A TaxID=2714924 RepID=UPI00140C6FA1|nr:DUF2976 domain-containing protein [Diaphorobacter sp. HDW4A]QIL80328.1 DUF2976 domain-containing protein [Diaphorobacter sp. HDW4A]
MEFLLKQRLQGAKTRLLGAREFAAKALLLPAVMVMSSPVMAALPTMTTPTAGIGGETVAEGDWLGAVGAWWKKGITILALIFVGYFFLKVVMGAIGKWGQYAKGQADIADLKEYVISGTVLAVALVLLASYAMKTLE